MTNGDAATRANAKFVSLLGVLSVRHRLRLLCKVWSSDLGITQAPSRLGLVGLCRYVTIAPRSRRHR